VQSEKFIKFSEFLPDSAQIFFGFGLNKMLLSLALLKHFAVQVLWLWLRLLELLSNSGIRDWLRSTFSETY